MPSHRSIKSLHETVSVGIQLPEILTKKSK